MVDEVKLRFIGAGRFRTVTPVYISFPRLVFFPFPVDWYPISAPSLSPALLCVRRNNSRVSSFFCPSPSIGSEKLIRRLKRNIGHLFRLRSPCPFSSTDKSPLVYVNYPRVIRSFCLLFVLTPRPLVRVRIINNGAPSCTHVIVQVILRFFSAPSILPSVTRIITRLPETSTFMYVNGTWQTVCSCSKLISHRN